MTITLTVGATTVALPDDLLWADETQWTRVQQAAEYTLTGALVVSTAVRLAGRPITLQPPDDQAAWMTRTTLDALMAWADTPGLVLALNLRGVLRSVMFRHHEPPALAAEPIVHFSDVEAGDFYLCTLRFMQV